MQPHPLRTTVIGSYPFPGWLEFASQHLNHFGSDDVAELQDELKELGVPRPSQYVESIASRATRGRRETLTPEQVGPVRSMVKTSAPSGTWKKKERMPGRSTSVSFSIVQSLSAVSGSAATTAASIRCA